MYLIIKVSRAPNLVEVTLHMHICHGQDRSRVLRPRFFQTENTCNRVQKDMIWSALAMTNVHDHWDNHTESTPTQPELHPRRDYSPAMMGIQRQQHIQTWIQSEQTLILWVYWEPVWDETLIPIQLVLSLQNTIHFGFLFDLIWYQWWFAENQKCHRVRENQKNCLKAAENWLKAVENRKSGKPERDG